MTETYAKQETWVLEHLPLMAGGKYTAAVDKINEVLHSYNSKYVEGFCGFTEDSAVAGQYNYEGTDLGFNVLHTKVSGSENVAAAGDEIPDTVMVSTVIKADSFEESLEKIVPAGAAAMTALDPETDYDSAFAQLKQCTIDAVEKAEDSVSTAELDKKNLKAVTGALTANDNLFIFYSFQSF